MKILKFKIFFLIGLLCFPTISIAERNDTQLWTLVTSNFSLDKQKKYQFYFELQPRIGDNINQLERLLIRPAFVYNFSNNLGLYLGYAWTPTYMNTNYDSKFRNENRIWQQILYKQQYGNLAVQHRLREEQRLLGDTEEFSNRLRYLLRLSHPFDSSKDPSFGITGYNEIFYTFNTVANGPKSGFDRNRAFIGLYKLIDSHRYEIGYVAEHGENFGNDDRLINGFLLSANLNF